MQQRCCFGSVGAESVGIPMQKDESALTASRRITRLADVSVSPKMQKLTSSSIVDSPLHRKVSPPGLPPKPSALTRTCDALIRTWSVMGCAGMSGTIVDLSRSFSHPYPL